MKTYKAEQLNGKTQKGGFTTRAAAIHWAMCERNRIKHQTGQKVRFKIIEE